jgi:glycosyltransferase involved in cell wall biosynthesis
MRIGMDASLLLYPEVAGMRIHLERLLEALLRVGAEHEFVLFHHTRRSWYGTAPLDRWRGDNVAFVPAPLPVRAAPDSLWWLGYHPPLEWLLPVPVDVFHAGDFMWPASRRTPLVATLHDLTPELYPELHVWPNRVRHRRQMAWFARHAARIISVSASSASDYADLFGDGVPIDVVHPGVGLAATAPPAASPITAPAPARPYILCVGTVEPRKNGVRLIHAFEQAFAEGNGPDLVFAGARGWRSADVYDAAARSPAADRISFTGRTSDAELAVLYSRATALAYPSLHEGFGLPLLEAMQAGIPVLTSNVSSLPEVAGDAALLVDPRDVSSIAAGLRRLWHEPELRDALAAAGRLRAARFTWDAAAHATLASYAAAAEDRT